MTLTDDVLERSFSFRRLVLARQAQRSFELRTSSFGSCALTVSIPTPRARSGDDQHRQRNKVVLILGPELQGFVAADFFVYFAKDIVHSSNSLTARNEIEGLG